TSVQMLGGSHGRAAPESESAASSAQGLNWSVTGTRMHERGWRAASPSDLRQLFAKVGMLTRDTELALTAAVADNDLTGNGLQEGGALQRERASVYTSPDKTTNRSAFLNLA